VAVESRFVLAKKKALCFLLTFVACVRRGGVQISVQLERAKEIDPSACVSVSRLAKCRTAIDPCGGTCSAEAAARAGQLQMTTSKMTRAQYSAGRARACC
jgi:hypothetical protein